MLGGKHFRRAPAARTGSRRRPSAPSPAPRRSSCPSRPHPAASGSSAWCRRVRRTSTSSTSRWPAVSSNGNCSAKRGRQPVVPRRRRRPGLAQLAVPALHQRPLQPDRLVEGQPLAWRGPGPLRVSARWTPRSASSSEIRSHCREHDSGSGSSIGIEHVEDLAHARVDVPALHLGGRRIDREEVPLEGRRAARPRRSAATSRRSSPATWCPCPARRPRAPGRPDASAASCR